VHRTKRERWLITGEVAEERNRRRRPTLEIVQAHTSSISSFKHSEIVGGIRDRAGRRRELFNLTVSAERFSSCNN